MGGSSGGGSSGAVSWPEWISELHREGAWSMLEVIHSVENPFAGISPFDPTGVLSWMEGETLNYKARVDSFDPAKGWEAAIDRVAIKYDQKFLRADILSAAMDTYSNLQRAEFESKVLPSFRAGMRDINAVQSSAFVVGEALLEGFFLEHTQKFGKELAMNMFSARPERIMGTAGKLLEAEIIQQEGYEKYLQAVMEFERIFLIAKKEYIGDQMDIDEAEARWSLEKWNNFGNYIAGMNGGTVHTTGRKPSTTASVLGGGFSGAATGFSMGGWWGAAAGGVLGAGSALAANR